jgi:beta-galactosidase
MAKMTRRSFTLLSGTLLSGGSVLAHAGLFDTLPAYSAVRADGASGGSTIFPYGTHVYREPHLPLEQLRQDFPILKRLGFSMIKIQEVWGYDEVHEGQIDLTNVSRVVSDARQNGLQVYFGVTMENPPMWLWKKFPDATMVYATGEPFNDPTPYVLPADGKPGPCWHHPEARAAGVRFIEEVSREIGKYDNIAVWNVFQEINFGPVGRGPLGLCYCHNTLAAFRAWLRARYSTLDALNATWRSSYGEWEEVEPPRLSPKVPPAIDWRYFMDDAYLSLNLKWKADVFRRTDALHRPILAHVGGVTPGSTREWRYGEELDILGSSCYPGWRDPAAWDFDHGTPENPLTAATQATQQVEDILMHFDQLRSAKHDGAIWTAELQGGPITEGLNRLSIPSGEDIRRWVLACLAAGSRGISFWNHRPEIFWEEGYGFSLLDWGSDSSARAEEAGRISIALNRHAELFAKGSHPQPAVAIVLNEDRFHWAECSLHDFKEHLQYTIAGLWRSLWRQGITTGFVESAAIPADASAVKALILPFPFAMGPREIDALTRYVRSGGTLIAEACPGRFNNYGIGFEGAMAPGIAELFGARSEGVFLIREPGKGAKWTNWQFGLRDSREYRELMGAGYFAQTSVFPAFYLQTLKLTTAQPLLMYGDEVAGSVNKLGQGTAYLAGTFLGHAGPAYNDWRNGEFLATALARAGVAGDRVGSLNRRRRTLDTNAAWFFFNFTEHAIEQSVPLEGFKSARNLLGEELPTTNGILRVNVAPLDICCIVLAS